jgi:hypothetical protein
MAPNVLEQLDKFKSLLRDKRLPKTHPAFKLALTWVGNFPGMLNERDKAEVKRLIYTCFSITEEEFTKELVGEENGHEEPQRDPKEIEKELRSICPTDGFIHRYLEYTSHSEAPLAYHLFCALLGIGSTLNRRVWFEMGYFKLFPNLGIIILGPSGLKKTSATNIIVSMLQELEVTKIYAERLTPEALVDDMKDMAQGIIYAPELAAVLGKQKYMEGAIPLITRLLDCPDIWDSKTIGRGRVVLRDVCISTLMCSTPEWFINNTPKDIVDGGFVARHILVVQESTPRSEPIPRPGSSRIRETLIGDLARIHEFAGEVTLDAETAGKFKQWYEDLTARGKHQESELMKNFYQRKDKHVIRVAMCLHIATHHNLVVCFDCFQRAIAIMDWMETFYPTILKQMFKTESGIDQELVLGTIRASGGFIHHSSLIRKLQHRLNSQQIRFILNSLKDAQQVDEIIDRLVHVWVLRKEGGNAT